MYNTRIVSGFFLCILFAGCSVELADPNTASEEEVLRTREGLIAAGVGLRAYYSTNSLLWIIENNALTTHEVSVTSSFQTAIDLEKGFDQLTSFNSNIGNQWASLLKIQSMASALLENVDQINAPLPEKNILKAHAYFYKAASTGFLAQSFTHVPWHNQSSIEFLSRQMALQNCVTILETAHNLLQETNIDEEFIDHLCGEKFDLANSILVYISRYQLYLGEYQKVLDILGEIDQTIFSQFEFGSDNPNPIYNRVFGSNLYYKPVENFGLASVVESTDARLAFYLEPLEASSQTGLPIEILKGFFNSPQSSIPVYLPGEIYLNRAEAFLNLDMPEDAVDMINAVRGKTNDPSGVNASLGTYQGPLDEGSIALEIYHQRCIELYMSGSKLEDSRRLGRPAPLSEDRIPLDRSRNFYPFPDAERSNNPDTPDNPPI